MLFGTHFGNGGGNGMMDPPNVGFTNTWVDFYD